MYDERHWQIRTVVLATFVLMTMQMACGPLFDRGMSRSAVYNSLVLRFQTDRSWAQVGESVHMQFTVQNGGGQPVVIESTHEPVMQIIVEDVLSHKVFLLWSVQNPDKVSHRLEWQPSESKTIELTWTAPQEEFGRGVFLTGTLSEGTEIVQDAGSTFYVGHSGP